MLLTWITWSDHMECLKCKYFINGSGALNRNSIRLIAASYADKPTVQLLFTDVIIVFT